MSRVVSFIGYVPPARWDGQPWRSVSIEEAPTPAGPWSLIDVQPIPPDADPTQPQVRNLTTSAATLADGWCRLTFVDLAGAQSEPSDPVRTKAGDAPLPPSPDDVRASSPLLRRKYPVPARDPFAVHDLRNVVYQATALVQANTWRLIDPTLGCSAPQGYVCEVVPPALVPVALNAIARMSERLEVTTEVQLAQQIATGRRLRGFSAGPYSESYFAPGEFARRGASQGRAPMDSDDALDAALWALATEDARDYFVWRATGVAPPVGSAVAFDYRKASVGYSGGQAGGWWGGGVHGGPDGW